MDYRTEDHRLIITIDDEERTELREAREENEDFDSDAFMCEFLEPLTCNSELDWIGPEETGDLTDAPILGIRDADNYETIVDRWAFMSYETISVQQALLDNGQAIFIQ